jgi:hypothetical protein
MERSGNQQVTLSGVPWSSRIGFVAFVVVALAAIAATMRLEVPGALWVLRIGFTACAVAFAIYLGVRDLGGQATDLDLTAFDRWTIVHASAGVVMGLFSIPFLLLAILTVCWEIFEILAPGFGEGEVIQNRAVDILVAWVGWLVAAGLIALVTQSELPFLLPAAGSLFRH